MQKPSLRPVLLALCLALSCAAPVAFAEPKAMDAGSEELFELQDAVLNDNYKRILRIYADDPVFIAKLKASQRAWLKFRDAELEALFPHAGTGRYGSSYEQARRHWMGKLTEERSAQLARWLEGVEPGDEFAGSIKQKPVEPPAGTGQP